MTPDEINYQAYKYAESTVPKLNAICSHLFKTKIKVFAYFRFFNNGSYLYLCNRLDWVQFCLENIHSNENTLLGQELSHVPADNYHCFLWPTVKTDVLMAALYDFNIWNGLSIFKHGPDSIELWGFAADRQTENIQDFYIENIELLKDFTAIFNLNASEIISPHNSHLARYKDFKEQPYLDVYNRKKINEFIQATPIKKRPIITDKGEFFLSTKELKCLNLLASGSTAKKIALNLHVSARTIEKHLENIKRKIDVLDKFDMIKIYKDSVLTWL